MHQVYEHGVWDREAWIHILGPTDSSDLRPILSLFFLFSKMGSYEHLGHCVRAVIRTSEVGPGNCGWFSGEPSKLSE